MKSSRLFAVVSALALAAGFTVTGARGDSSNSAILFLNPSFSGGAGAYEEFHTAPGVQTAGGGTTGGFNTTLNGSAYADYGVIKNFVSAYGSATAQSRGIFRDSVTITSPGVSTGTFGKLTFGIYVNGLLQADSGSTSAGWHLQADLGGGASDINKSAETLYAPIFPNGYVGDPLGTTYFGTIDFQFGMPMQLYVELDVSVAVAFDQPNSPGSATSNFLNSLYWNGMTNVTLGGTPVPSFSAASTSGVNWAVAAVPEPASLALLAIAAMPLLARRSRR